MTDQPQVGDDQLAESAAPGEPVATIDWSPTMRLRFVEKPIGATSTVRKVLQQLWLGHRGYITNDSAVFEFYAGPLVNEWRDVPLETE